MKPETKSVLILLGGMWHDFAGYATTMQPVFEAEGWQVESTYDLDVLTQFGHSRWDLLLSYTCMTAHRQGFDDQGPEKMTDEQVSGLIRWVQNGGALLAAHAATVVGDSDPRLGELFGGIFLSHPDPFLFTVYPLANQHPITAGLPAFEVHDEFYLQEYDPSVEIHMAAIYQGVVHPMAWSRSEGNGRVAVITPGHFPAVWKDPTYQRLMLQTAGWLTMLRQ